MGSHSGAVLAAGGSVNGGDKLSGLGDAVLGHMLSFLPADEAARAAALSRRWRHVFAHVHTVALDEPEPPIPDYDGDWSPGYCKPTNVNAVDAPPFANAVSAALFGRLRRLPGGAAGVPLRALRVGFQGFSCLNAGLLDMWLWYAMRQAGDELHLDLRLRNRAICGRNYSLHRTGADDTGKEAGGNDAGGQDDDGESEPADEDEDSESADDDGESNPADDDGESEPADDEEESEPADDDEDSEPADDDKESEPADDEEPPPPSTNEYVTPRSLFSCAALRTLRIGPCRLDLPAAIALPSLDTLHLTRVTGRKSSVQRLVSACPRLADLTLEACEKLTELALLGTRLRRLALRCCHDLAAVAADSSELRAFEYRGAVPEPSFLTLCGGARKLSSCTVDICGAEATDPRELDTLGCFLLLFVGVKRLRLTSARLGCAADLPFPAFSALRRLELTGMLPEDDDGTAAVATVSRILERTPGLEALTLFFLPEPDDLEEINYYSVDEDELLDGHKLKYDQFAVPAVPDAEIPCLRERTKEINFVHYEGGVGQRMLAKFLLRNAPLVGEVCGEFAQGPLWIQTKLMEEIKGWVMNKSADLMFF